MLFPTTKYLRFGTITPEHEAPWTAAFHGKGMGESPAFKITWPSAVSSPLGGQGWNAKLQRDKPGPWGAAVPTPLPHNSHHVSPTSQLHNPPCGTSQTSTKDPCPNQKGSHEGHRHQQKEENAQIIPGDSRSYVQNKDKRNLKTVLASALKKNFFFTLSLARKWVLVNLWLFLQQHLCQAAEVPRRTRSSSKHHTPPCQAISLTSRREVKG